MIKCIVHVQSLGAILFLLYEIKLMNTYPDPLFKELPEILLLRHKKKVVKNGGGLEAPSVIQIIHDSWVYRRFSRSALIWLLLSVWVFLQVVELKYAPITEI